MPPWLLREQAPPPTLEFRYRLWPEIGPPTAELRELGARWPASRSDALPPMEPFIPSTGQLGQLQPVVVGHQTHSPAHGMQEMVGGSSEMTTCCCCGQRMTHQCLRCQVCRAPHCGRCARRFIMIADSLPLPLEQWRGCTQCVDLTGWVWTSTCPTDQLTDMPGEDTTDASSSSESRHSLMARGSWINRIEGADLPSEQSEVEADSCADTSIDSAEEVEMNSPQQNVQILDPELRRIVAELFTAGEPFFSTTPGLDRAPECARCAAQCHMHAFRPVFMLHQCLHCFEIVCRRCGRANSCRDGIQQESGHWHCQECRAWSPPAAGECTPQGRQTAYYARYRCDVCERYVCSGCAARHLEHGVTAVHLLQRQTKRTKRNLKHQVAEEI